MKSTRTPHLLVRAAAMLAATSLAIAGAVVAAPAALAIPPGHVTSVTGGPTPGSLSVTWMAGGPSSSYVIWIAPVSLGWTDCDWPDTDLQGWTGYFTADYGETVTTIVSSPINAWYSSEGGNDYPLTPGAQYLVCMAQSGGSYAPIVGTTSPDLGRPPADVLQQLPIPATGDCKDVVDADLAWGTGLSGGWAKAWGQWLDAGKGGLVCSRTLHYSVSAKKWLTT